MADSAYTSMSGAKVQALAAQARNANSVLRLWRFGLAPNVSTPRATFIANEANFSGYAAITIATWSDPFLLGQAWATAGGQQIFEYDSGAGSVGNQLGGWWLETAGGDLLDYGIFDPSRPCQGDGMVIIVEPSEAFAAG